MVHKQIHIFWQSYYDVNNADGTNNAAQFIWTV